MDVKSSVFSLTKIRLSFFVGGGLFVVCCYDKSLVLSCILLHEFIKDLTKHLYE